MVTRTTWTRERTVSGALAKVTQVSNSPRQMRVLGPASGEYHHLPEEISTAGEADAALSFKTPVSVTYGRMGEGREYLREDDKSVGIVRSSEYSKEW